MVDRIQNVIKADRRKARQAGGDLCTSPKRRQKKDIEKQNLARRYPITSTSTLVDAASTASRVERKPSTRSLMMWIWQV